MKKKAHNPKLMGQSKIISKEAIYNKSLPQEIRKTSNNQSNIIAKGTRKRKMTRIQNQQKKKTTIKIRREINEIKTNNIK